MENIWQTDKNPVLCLKSTVFHWHSKKAAEGGCCFSWTRQTDTMRTSWAGSSAGKKSL